MVDICSCQLCARERVLWYLLLLLLLLPPPLPQLAAATTKDSKDGGEKNVDRPSVCSFCGRFRSSDETQLLSRESGNGPVFFCAVFIIRN